MLWHVLTSGKGPIRRKKLNGSVSAGITCALQHLQACGGLGILWLNADGLFTSFSTVRSPTEKATLCEFVMLYGGLYVYSTPAWISISIICFTLWQMWQTIQMAGLHCLCDQNMFVITDIVPVKFLFLVCISFSLLEIV